VVPVVWDMVVVAAFGLVIYYSALSVSLTTQQIERLIDEVVIRRRRESSRGRASMTSVIRSGRRRLLPGRGPCRRRSTVTFRAVFPALFLGAACDVLTSTLVPDISTVPELAIGRAAGSAAPRLPVTSIVLVMLLLGESAAR
jgi:hypothetical protein